MKWRKPGGPDGHPLYVILKGIDVPCRERAVRAAEVEGPGEINRHTTGGALMKRTAFVILSAVLLLGTGCATKEYVKTQVDPLSDRLGKIEARLNDLDAKINQVAAKEAQLTPADRAAIDEAKTMAKNAMDAATKAQADAASAAGDAGKAAASAKKAEDAAAAAEQSAAKAEKMFKLQQKK